MSEGWLSSRPMLAGIHKCLCASVFFALTARLGFTMKADAKMKNEIMEEMLWDTKIKSRDIVVRVHQGVVTLSGTVSNYAEKAAAELAVQRVSGVKAIAEELEVHVIDGQLRSDAQVADSVARTLAWHVWVPSHILATVENGLVRLNGSINGIPQRTQLSTWLG